MSAFTIIDLAEVQTALEHYQPAEEKILSGNPQQSVKDAYTSPCGQFMVGEWSGEPGCWKVNYSEYEYCEILEGESIITDAEGQQKRVVTGDRFVIPAGFSGTWEVISRCRKVYVIFEAK